MESIKMRTLTKLESKLLGCTPTESTVINEVLTGAIVHPLSFRRGAGRFQLQGVNRKRIVQILGALDIRTADIEFGNDAPRGGVAGKWIRLAPSGKAKARRRLS